MFALIIGFGICIGLGVLTCLIVLAHKLLGSQKFVGWISEDGESIHGVIKHKASEEHFFSMSKEDFLRYLDPNEDRPDDLMGLLFEMRLPMLPGQKPAINLIHSTIRK